MTALATEIDNHDTSEASIAVSIDVEVPKNSEQNLDAADSLVFDTNVFLSKMGYGDRAFANAADLVASVSSMSVVLYERLFRCRLRDIKRVPRTRQDYEFNAQVVVDALRGTLLTESNDEDPNDNITGERLCTGDVGCIRRLLKMLQHVYTVLYEEDPEAGARLRNGSFSSLDEALHKETLEASTRRVPPKLVKKKRKKSRASERDSTDPSKLKDPIRTSFLERKETSLFKKCLFPSRLSKHNELRDASGVNGSPKVRTRKRIPSVSRTNKARPKPTRGVAEKTKKRSRVQEPTFEAASSAAKKDNEGHVETKRDRQRFVAAVTSGTSEEDNDGNHVLECRRRKFFEGISSIQHNSDESMHQMGEEGAFVHTFSSISIDDPESELKVDDDDTGAAADYDVGDQENDAPSENLETETPTYHKSLNQQEAQVSDNVTSISPVKKTMARDEPHALERPPSVASSQRDKVKSLYPLLPKTRQQTLTSKAQAQHLRYKLAVKNRLQELRQQEASQRQHLERAFKSGEHTANVDKIRRRRFEQDVRLHRIAVGLEARNEEEKQLRHAMKHLLGLEKEKLREEHRMTTAVLKQIQQEHAEREEAMETFYAHQIQLVKEQSRREANERELVEKAQRAASEKMMRELRQERENQLTALLEKKKHVEERRRFRQASKMAQLLNDTNECRAKRTDAFYTAAMKARELHSKKKQQPVDPNRVYTKPVKKRGVRSA